MTTSANAITETIMSNESKHLLLNPSLPNSLPESTSSNAGHASNKLHSLSPAMETCNDFSLWNRPPATDETKVI